MSQEVIIVPNPIEPFNHRKKLLELVVKGAVLGGALSYFIATKRYSINKVVDLRKRLASERFFTHTKKLGVIGAAKGAGLGLAWYVLYYQLFDKANHPRDDTRTVAAYTIMGCFTVSVLLNPALMGTGLFTGLMMGGASVMKEKGLRWRPEGSQVYYKDVGEKQRNKTLADYNLRILGLETILTNPNDQYVFPTRI